MIANNVLVDQNRDILNRRKQRKQRKEGLDQYLCSLCFLLFRNNTPWTQTRRVLGFICTLPGIRHDNESAGKIKETFGRPSREGVVTRPKGFLSRWTQRRERQR